LFSKDVLEALSSLNTEISFMLESGDPVMGPHARRFATILSVLIPIVEHVANVKVSTAIEGNHEPIKFDVDPNDTLANNPLNPPQPTA